MNEPLALSGLVFSFLALVVLSNAIRRQIISISVLLTNRNSLGIKLYSLLFLPGTIIHELGHFLTAAVLLVPTGTITIFPEDLDDNRVKLGSVQVARTDFLRGSLIGIAPLVVGCVLLLVLYEENFASLSQNILKLPATFIQELVRASQHAAEFAALYLMLAIGNSMFTSKEDARYWPVVALLFIPFFVAFIIGGQFNIASHTLGELASVVSIKLTNPFLFTALIDVGLLIPLWLLKRLLENTLHKHLRYS